MQKFSATVLSYFSKMKMPATGMNAASDMSNERIQLSILTSFGGGAQSQSADQLYTFSILLENLAKLS